MVEINIRSISDAVSKGTLIELANDYRTSSTVRACLPKATPYSFAISRAAFGLHVQQGTAGEKRSRMEAICVFLSKILGLTGKPSLPDLVFKFPRKSGDTEEDSLKAEWYAPNKYWVLLLPNEQLSTPSSGR